MARIIRLGTVYMDFGFLPYGSEKNPRIILLVSEYKSNLMINLDKGMSK